MRVRLEVRRAPWRRRTQRSDGLWKGRRSGIGYAARDMARQVKWEDPALRRERKRKRERARVGDARVKHEKAREREKRERERGHARVGITGGVLVTVVDSWNYRVLGMNMKK
jgi:hypothetical protein